MEVLCMLVSVIVPVYNVEKYLCKCLDSIIQQTYKDLEIILVDDGSTDSSGLICDDYAAHDNRVHVIHKKNEGLSEARNSGLEICSGDYIGFVDSDDWIATDMFEKLVKFVKCENLDVAMCGVADVWPEHVVKTPSFKKVILTNVNDIISEILVNRHGGTAIPVWCRIYKSSLFKTVKFEKERFYEDGFYLLKWIERTRRFGRFSDSEYFYNHREGSITNIQGHSKRVDDFRKAYEDNYNYVKQHFPNSLNAAEYRLFFTYRSILNLVGNTDLPYSHEIANKFKKNLLHIWKNPYMNIKIKLIYTLIGINPLWYLLLRQFGKGCKSGFSS
jgi:glycosyltransferase involved in cell wall biosynthesis